MASVSTNMNETRGGHRTKVYDFDPAEIAARAAAIRAEHVPNLEKPKKAPKRILHPLVLAAVAEAAGKTQEGIVR